MQASAANLILFNANMISGEPDKPKAEAIAIQGDRILLVGSNQEVERVKDNQTRLMDCQGKTVVPGFNDAHCHIFSLVRQLFSLDLSPAAVHSIEDIKQAVRCKVKSSPAGRWIYGTDYHEFSLAEKRHPHRWDLDEVAPLHPVMLIHRSRHAAVLNSLALKLVGITNESEEPTGGLIDRDLNTGEPNGLLFEMVDFLRSRTKSPLSGAEMEWGLSEINRGYLSKGITSIGEATASNDLAQWQTYRELKQAGQLKSRISMLPGAEAFYEFKDAGLVTGSGDRHLRVGALKIVISEARGELRPTQKELNQLVLEASRAGFQVAIHAVEQSTVEAAIMALEYSESRFQHGVQRYRIEHCAECPPEFRLRLNRLKAVVVSQPPFIYYNGERYLAQVPAKPQKWLYPFKSLMDGGLTVAGSSDSPVAPNNPLMGIYAAVTRRAESGQTVLAKEAVSVKQALEMYTLNAAYATFEEKIKGSLAPGKLADMVMLSGDPLESPPDSLKDITVEMTVLGGEVVWETP